MGPKSAAGALVFLTCFVATVSASITVSNSVDLVGAFSAPPADGVLYVQGGRYDLCGKIVSNIHFNVSFSIIGQGATPTIECTLGGTIFEVYGWNVTLVNLNFTSADQGLSITDGDNIRSIVRMINVTFDTISGSTGAYSAVSLIKSSLLFTNITFRNCRNNSPILLADQTTFTGTGLRCINNRGGNGGCIDLNAQHSTIVDISNASFIGNTAATSGGAIYAYNGGNDGTLVVLRLSNVYFVGNSASTRQGGALYAFGYPSSITLTLSNVTFDGNVASQQGGALYADTTFLQMSDSVFTNNLQASIGTPGGGAIFLQSCYNATLRSVSIASNTGNLNGAGMNVRDLVTPLQMNSVRFISNIVTGDGVQNQLGGALYLYHTRVYATGLIVQGHQCPMCSGAGIFFGTSDSLTLIDATFSGNHAGGSGGMQYGGGAIFADNSLAVLTIIRGTFFNNTADNLAGGIFACQSQSLLIQSSTFTRNDALRGGGAVFGSTTITTTILDTNFTANHGGNPGGGAIYFPFSYVERTVSITRCNFTANSADTAGGALLLENNGVGSASIFNSIFTDNVVFSVDKCPTTGGAVKSYFALSVSDSVFRRNRAENTSGEADTGGAISTVQTLTLANCVFDGNSATVGGAVDSGSSACITACNFTRNVAVSYGGAVRAALTVTVVNSHFYRNSAPTRQNGYGQAGAMKCGGYCVMISSTFVENSAFSTGGAVQIIVGGTNRVTISGCHFSSNSAATDTGGAVSVANVDEILMTNSTFYYNSAGSSAGAMEINSAAFVTVDSCDFEFNRAGTLVEASGGAFFVASAPTNIFVQRSTFAHNSATGCGGAMFLAGCSDLTMESFLFVGNSACQSGGAVLVYNDHTSVKLTNGLFTNNTAGGDGGAVDVAAVEIRSVNFYYNQAFGIGGGLHMHNPLTVPVTSPCVTGCNFVSNSAFEGGGLYAEHDPLSIILCTFTSNTATLAGGGLYTTGISSALSYLSLQFCVFEFNVLRPKIQVTSSTGGGAFLSFDSPPLITDCTFHGNSAGSTPDSFGGGLVTQLAGLGAQGPAGESIDIYNCDFTSNYAPSGGGWYMDGSTIVASCSPHLIHGTQFVNNRADNDGGGYFVTTGTQGGCFSIRLEYVNFTTNTAGGRGGGFYSVGQQSIFFGPDDSSMTPPVAISFSSNTAAFGGAMALQQYSNVHNLYFQRANVTFVNNTASAYGGAISTMGSLYIRMVHAGTIFKHNAAAFGGGISIQDGDSASAIELDGVEFYYNRAKVSGGAVYFDLPQTCSKCSLISTGGVFVGNMASVGGAIAVTVSSTALLTNAQFLHNVASDSGGGIAGDVYSTIQITGSSTDIFNNTAANFGGGIYFGYVSQLGAVVAATLRNNTALQGGAIYIAEANYAFPVDIHKSVFTGNSARESGGAIYANGLVSINNSSAFISNRATNYGGGLYAVGFAHVQATAFVGNTAAYSGGIHCQQCQLIIGDGATLQNNVALMSGGALSCLRGSTLSLDPTVTFGANPSLSTPNDLRVADCTACGCCDLPNMAIDNVAPCMSYPNQPACNYSCPYGYDTLPVAQYSCLAGPQLSSTTVCFARPCPTNPYFPPNGGFDRSPVNTTTGTTLMYGCEPGYTYSGALNITCDGYNWNPAPGGTPLCTPNACSPDLPNILDFGYWTVNHGYTGNTSMLVCPPGFITPANPVSMCQGGNPTGTWSNSGLVCLKTACPALAAPTPPLRVDRTTGESGDVTKYYCDPKYAIQGTAALYCNGTAWNGTAPTCVGLPCYRIDEPENGTLTYLDPNNNPVAPGVDPPLGSKIVCTCKAGYQSSGQMERTCNVPPNWDGPPCVCTAAQCVIALDYAGVISCPFITPFQGTCNAECPAGYSADKTRVEGAICEQAELNGATAFNPTLPVCTSCSSNSFSAGNVITCTPCPNGGTTPGAGATSQANCSCLRGWYEANQGAGDCIACPFGADCAGDREQPKSSPGFFFTGEGYLACSPTVACSGDNHCSEGYTGYLCGACDAHFYRLNGNCVACPNDVWWRVLLAVIVALILAYGLVVIVRPSEIGERSYGFASATIGLSFIQIVATFADLRVPWPVKTKQMFAVFSFLNLNIELASPECFATFTFWQKFQLQMSVPLIVAGLLILLWVIWSLVAWLAAKRPPLSITIPRVKNIAKVITGAFLFFLTVAYLLLADATLSIFACSARPNNKYTLAEAPTEFCYEGPWTTNAPIGILGVVLYICMIPVLVLGVYYRIRAKYGAHVATRSMFANYLVKKYMPNRWYWEAVTMLRKLTVVIVATLFYDNAYLQVALSSAVFFFCCVATLVFRPYRWQKHNLLEIISLIGSLIVLFCGQMSGSPLYGPIQQEVLAIIAIVTVVITLMCMVACFALETSIFYDIYKLNQKLHAKGDLTVASTPSSAIAVLTHEDEVIVVSKDGIVRGHNSKTLDPNLSMSVNQQVTAAVLCDRNLLVGGGNEIALWSLDSRACLAVATTHHSTTVVASSVTDIITADTEGTLLMWKTPEFVSRRGTFTSLSAAELNVVFEGDPTDEPDTSSTASKLVPVRTIAQAHTGPVTALYAESGFVFSAGSDGRVKKWSVESGLLLREWVLPMEASTPTVVHDTGVWLLVGDNRGLLHVCSHTDTPARVIRTHTAAITGIASAGETVLVSSADGCVVLYSADTIAYRQTLSLESPTAVTAVSVSSSDPARCFWADTMGRLKSHDVQNAWDLRDFDPQLATRAWNLCLARLGRGPTAASIHDEDPSSFAEFSLLSDDLRSDKLTTATDVQLPELSGSSAVALNDIMSRHSAQTTRK